MKKETKQAVEAFVRENDLDSVTLSMVVAHYMSIGEQVASRLTDIRIEEVCKAEEEKQKAAESRGSIYLVTPEFTKFLLTTCQKLYLLPDEVKHAIIMEAWK